MRMTEDGKIDMVDMVENTRDLANKLLEEAGFIASDDNLLAMVCLLVSKPFDYHDSDCAEVMKSSNLNLYEETSE
jgi:hypothetical protein